MVDNVVTFPKIKLGTPPQSVEEVKTKLEEFRVGHSEQIAEFLWQNLLAEMVRSGCNFNKDIEHYFPSMFLVLESIKSLHLLTHGLPHDLQNFANDSIDVNDFADEIDGIVDNDEELE